VVALATALTLGCATVREPLPPPPPAPPGSTGRGRDDLSPGSRTGRKRLPVLRTLTNVSRMAVRTSTARRERAHERARRDILLAAAGVFARRGYAAATLADLAEAAGYAPPSLYRYFESKEEIYRSLLDLLLEELAATFEEPVDRSLPFAARLEALLRSQARLAASRREIFSLLASHREPDAPGVPGKHPLTSFRAGESLYERQLAAWLRRNASRRELRCSVDDAARVIAGIGSAFHHRPPADEREPAVLARLVVDLALNGISAPGGAGTDGARGVST